MTAKTLLLLLPAALLLAPSVPARAFDDMGGLGDLRGDARIVHVLNRLAYGPRPGDVAKVKEEGLFPWIVLQLHPERIPDDACEKRLEDLPHFRMTVAELEKALPPATKEDRKRLADLTKKVARLRKEKAPPREVKAVQDELNALRRKNDRNLPLRELTRAKMIRAVFSERQLLQVMTDFWFNHFNVFGRKGPSGFLIPSLEEHAIRPHALGKFRDLLVAVAKSPAMLFYLDNWLSVAEAGAPTAAKKGRKRARRGKGINENYARELLELHTLGVDDGYDQRDVIEVARCFTGWTIAGGGYRGRGFEFKPEVHDAGPKRVLGRRFPPGRGLEDGMAVLDMLATHPGTAHFISTKLCRRFVSDDPPPALVKRCAETFLETDGDIRMVLYRIFTSPEFFSEEAAQAKVKKPHGFVASALRALGVTSEPPRQVYYKIAEMGEPLYLCEPPTGYPDCAEEWAGSNAVLARVNFATALAFGRVGGAKPDWGRLLRGAPEGDPEALLDWLVRKYVGRPLSSGSQVALSRTVEQAAAAIRSGRRKVGRNEAASFLTALILGSPDFQLR